MKIAAMATSSSTITRASLLLGREPVEPRFSLAAKAVSQHREVH
jgi:hypothetical protein